MHDDERRLYGEQTRLTLENMSFSGVPLSKFPLYIGAMAQVKAACALANQRAGLLDETRMQSIIDACRLLVDGQYVEQFPVDVYHGGGGIGLNMNVNEVIAALAGEAVHPINDVNLSQSTSDVCHTALHLALLDGLEALETEASACIVSLETLAHRFEETETIARTCWQDGMKVSAGAVFEGAKVAFARQREDLQRLHQMLLEINLGWTVIGTGTGAPEVYRKEILAALNEMTGRTLLWTDCPLEAAQYPDDLAAVSSAVLRLAQIAAKISRDLRLLASGPETGLGELQLPAVQAGSSFFPGKVNPVIPEMVIQCAMLIEGHDGIIQRAVGLGEIHINLWEEMVGFLLMDNIDMLRRSLQSLRTRCLNGIVLNETTCREYAASRIPQVVAAKETYGYAYLSRRIKEEGLEAVIEDLKCNNQ